MPNKNNNKYQIKSLSSTLWETDKFVAEVILTGQLLTGHWLTGQLLIGFKY